MIGKCSNCSYYRPKTKQVGMCLIKVKLMKYNGSCELYMEDTEESKYTKITIRNGKKIYS